jgi:hypothetical protein
MFSLIPVKNHLQPERLGIANNDLPQNLRLLQQMKQETSKNEYSQSRPLHFFQFDSIQVGGLISYEKIGKQREGSEHP